MSKKLLWQDRNRIRTEKAEKLTQQRTLWIVDLTHEEIEHMRMHVFYSCAGSGYIASFAGMLPLAIAELTKIRKGTVAVVKLTRRGFELSTADKR